MCGISGLVSRRHFKPQALVAMNTSIRHRGPDDEGYVLFKDLQSPPIVCGGQDTCTSQVETEVDYTSTAPIDKYTDSPCAIAFGHRRLSILDLSPLGHQPMCSPDGQFWIVYNGEIYNYLELRSELEALGYHFITESDTEVLIASYQEWGADCLHRLNGMWAFAIFDVARQEIFLARDRFGIKPLYYWVSPENIFCFASEIKQFTVLPGWQANLNGQRSYDYLAFGLTDHTDETLFDGVYQLPPGHRMTVSCRSDLQPFERGRLTVERWYQLMPQPFDGTFADACDGFKSRFFDSVSLRLRADVEIGSCLSGGLDSSSIVCAMNRLLQEKGAHGLQKTFSACTDVEALDERKWIDVITGATEVDPHYVKPSLENLFGDLESITWHQDEPFGSSSISAQWNVFRKAAEKGVKVMLDGQGSDEYLVGYHIFFGPYLATRFKSMQWFKLMQDMRALTQLHGYGPSVGIKYMANCLLPKPLVQQLRKIDGRSHVRPKWLNMKALGAEPEDPFEACGARQTSIRSLSYAQMLASNLQMLLHYEDRNSMACSVEARVPFLDYRLVEYVLGLPDEYKLSGGVTKRVLRESMAGVLPEAIRARMDKISFATPEENWMRKQAPELFQKKIDQAIEASSGVLLGPSTREFFQGVVNGRVRYGFLPWRMISFGEWMKVYNVSV